MYPKQFSKLISTLEQLPGVGEKTAWKAINGKRIGAPVVARIAEALDVDPMAFLVDDREDESAD